MRPEGPWEKVRPLERCTNAARDSFFAGLNSRKSSKLRRALLVNTVKSGRWSDPNSSRFWGEGVAARTALKSLDKETLDAFKAAGKIHRSLW